MEVFICLGFFITTTYTIRVAEEESFNSTTKRFLLYLPFRFQENPSSKQNLGK